MLEPKPFAVQQAVLDLRDLKKYLSPQPILRMTTELKATVPNIDFSFVVQYARTFENRLAPVQVFAPHFPLESFPDLITADLAALSSAFQIWKETRPYAQLLKTPSSLPHPETSLPVLNLPLQLEHINNSCSSRISGFFTEIKAFERPERSFFLDDVRRGLQETAEQTDEALRTRRQRLQELLSRLEQRLNELFLPTPSLAGAVPTSGAGPVRWKGGAPSPSVIGLLLSPRWELDREIRLTVFEGPVIKDGRLQLTLKVDEPELMGRHADLIFIAEDLEVVLGSALVTADKKIRFTIDLTTIQFRQKEGLLPLHVFRVIIKPDNSTKKG